MFSDKKVIVNINVFKKKNVKCQGHINVGHLKGLSNIVCEYEHSVHK